MRSRLVFLIVLAALTIVAVVDTARGGLNRLEGIGPVFLEAESSNVNQGASMDERTPHVTKSGSLKMGAAGIARFGIANDFGSVTVTSGSGDIIELAYDITVYAESEDEAREYAERCSVDLDASDGAAIARLNQPKEPSAGISGIVTSFVVRLPARLKVDVVNHFGEATVDKVSGDVYLENHYGVTRASDLGGSLVARTGFSAVEVSKVAKDADIDLQQGSLTLNGIGGSLTLTARYARVEASDIDGKLDLFAQHGQVDMEGVGEGVTARSSFSPVSGRDLHGPVFLTSEHGPVDISGIDGETRVQTRYAPVHVRLGEAAQGYQVEMRARFGSIDADVPVTTGEPVQNEERASALVGQGGIPVRVEAEFGKITLRARK